MSSIETRPSAFFSKRVYWTIVPFLALAMIVTTSAAGFPGVYFYWKSLGSEHIGTVIRCYAVVTLATATLEGLFIFGGIWLIWRLLKRITSLTDEMQMLTRSVLHDLSTPISHIQHQADLIGEPETDNEAVKAAISASCTRILKVVRLSAEISKTYEGLDRSSAEPVDFSAVIRNACEIFEAAAAEKGVRLECHMPDAPIILKAHTYRLQRLVSNLIDNAIKFTPTGGQISVSLERKGTSSILKVADTGIGMTPEEQSLAFQRFYRADKSRGTPGSGLGLSLVHAIVDFYHGTIAVESEQNRGTIFIITLPCT